MEAPELKTELKDFGKPEDSREALIIGLAEGAGGLDDRLAAIDAAAGGVISAALNRGDFCGRAEQAISLFSGKEAGPLRVILAGLGDSSDYNGEAARRALTAGLKAVARLEVVTVDVDLGSFALGELGGVRAAELAAETSYLALWRNLRYRTELEEEEKPKIERVNLLWSGAGGEDDAGAAALAASTVAKGTCYARDLVSRPSNELYPETLAEEAEEIGRRHGFAVEVMDEERLKREGMNVLLAVGAGSARPARLIVIDSAPESGEKPIALVGKGITFDSGGISIKPSKGMEEMKGDMAGAAAVLAAVDVLGRLGWERRVLCVVPAAENMLGPASQRPGDIWRAYQGTMVEVLNTDAEGRLALADALAYTIKKYEPAAIIDIATLTGACVVALGYVASGLCGNDDGLCEAIQKAGERTGELVWRLPLFPDYEELLESEIADIKNVGDKFAGAISASFFLKRFVGESRWAHLDIAGPSWLPKAKSYLPVGPTGVGVRLLVETLMRQLDVKKLQE